jgi:hypothetical protein
MPNDLPILTQDQVDEMNRNGAGLYIDGQNPVQRSPDGTMSPVKAATSTAKAHAGGILGGGAGALAAPWLLGPEAGLPADLVMGILGSVAGGYSGQKAQQAIESPDTYQAQQEEAAQAEKQHPLVSGATDIGLSALASGGAFSPGTVVKALKGDTDAIKNVALQSTINPAISAGMSIASSGQLPSTSELASQAIGGALFSRPSLLGQWAGRVHPTPDEPLQEPTDKLQPTEPTTPSPWTEKDENGNYKIGDDAVRQAWMDQHPKPLAKKIQDPIQLAQARSAYDQARTLDTETIRDQLHQKFITDAAQKASTTGIEPTPEPLKLVSQDGITTPPITTEGEANPMTQENKNTATVPSPNAIDFNKALAEKVSQEQEAAKIGSKPPTEDKPITTPQPKLPEPATQTPQTRTLTPNQMRILNPDNLVGSEIARPETMPVNLQGKVLPQEGARTPEEELQDKMEGNKAVYTSAQPYGENHIATPASLMGHIISGRATTGSVLHSLANTPNHPFKELANELLVNSDTKSLGTPVYANKDIKRSAFQMWKDGNDNVKLSLGNLNDSRVLMEELVHSLTARKIPSFEGATGKELHKKYQDYLADPSANPAIKDLINAHLQVAKALGHEDIFFGEEGLAGSPDKAQDMLSQVAQDGSSYGYAMGNLSEFLAQAFKDKDFQTILNRIPSGQPNRTIWQKIVDAVRRLLGVDVKQGSMLDHVLRTGTEIASQPKDKYAIQKSSTGKVFQREQEETGKAGSERERVEPSLEGNVFARQEGNLSTSSKREVEPTVHMGAIGRTTQSVIDKIAELPHEGAKEFAKGAKLALNEQHELQGRFKNPIIEASKGLTEHDKTQLNKVINAEITTKVPQPQLLQNDRQKKFYNEVKKQMDATGKYAIANKIPIMNQGVPRLMRQDPTHWPGMANQKIEQLFRNNTDFAAMKAAENRFDEWNRKSLGMSAADSKERIENWKQAIQGSSSNLSISHQDYFNAIRKAQGYPLPPEFREQNPVKAMSRYMDRFAVAASHYKNIEANPKIMAALGQAKDAWGKTIVPDKQGTIASNPTVKTALHQFKGEASGAAEHNEEAISSIATSALISAPPLEAHKMISNQVKAISFADNPYQMARMLAHGLSNIKSGYIHAKENGVIKLTATSAGDMLNGSLTSAERMLGASKLIRNVSTLGGLTTKANAALLQSQMEYLIPSKISRANAGDVTSQQFIKNLDPTYEIGKKYSTPEQQKLASLAAGYIHGTGDIRSMPAWMMNDGEVSGFFKLAHWSVAQTNNFMKDVWTPAVKNGDYVPLINSVFGSLVGGYLIKELRQDISGKKSPIPSLQEIAAGEGGLSAHPELLAYNAIAAMQYSGFGGLLSQVAKYPFDFVYKNAPQGATFPLDELATDLLTTIKQVSGAIANDPNVNWVDLTKAVTQHVLGNNIQLSRIAINQGIDSGLITGLPAEKKQLADKMAQLRRYDMVAGLPYNDIDEGSNPFMNIEQKKFKADQDVGDAVKQLPQLINNIVTTYAGKPDVMMQKFKALKQNEYADFPSITDMPIQFGKYLAYLQREEGPESAQALLLDYIQHRAINEAKSSAIP